MGYHKKAASILFFRLATEIDSTGGYSGYCALGANDKKFVKGDHEIKGKE